jgi:hypothetical protein
MGEFKETVKYIYEGLRHARPLDWYGAWMWCGLSVLGMMPIAWPIKAAILGLIIMVALGDTGIMGQYRRLVDKRFKRWDDLIRVLRDEETWLRQQAAELLRPKDRTIN